MGDLRIGIDARGARKGASTFTSSARTIKRGAGSIVKALNPLHMSMGKLGTYASIGGLAYGVTKAVRSFATLEKELATVSTMLDKATMEYLPKYERGLRDLSKKYGESTSTLSKGLYDVLSASVEASKAMGVLETSSIAAKAGITDTGVAVDAVTTILNSYNLGAEKAGYVTDILFTTVKRGKTTFGELAGGIGQVVSVAATAELSLEEVGAAIATMTRAGVKNEMAITSLKNIITTFLKPTDDARKVAKELGIELSSNTLKTMGLTGVLGKLKGATAEQLVAIMPNIRGFVGFAAAMKQVESHAKDLDAMLDSSGATMEAFGKMSGTADYKLSQLKQSLIDTSRIVGKAFLDDAVAGVEALNSWLDKNEIKIEYWSSVASIEFTRVRKTMGAFAEYLKSDFTGATDVAWDVFLAGLESASKAAIDLAIRTGKGIWQGVKSGVLGDKFAGIDKKEATRRALESYETAGLKWRNTTKTSWEPVQQKKGKLISLSGPTVAKKTRKVRVPADSDAYNKIKNGIMSEMQTEAIMAGLGNSLENRRKEYKQERDSILARAGITKHGSVFTSKLDSFNTEAEAQKQSAKSTYQLAKFKQDMQPAVEMFKSMKDDLKSILGFKQGSAGQTPRNAPVNKPASAKPVLSQDSLDARGKIAEMFSALEEEKQIIGMVNESRHRGRDIIELESLGKQGLIKDTEGLIKKYKEELKALRDAERLRNIADGIGESFARAFENMATGAASASDAIKSLGREVASLIMRQTVTQPMANMISDGVMGIFGPKKAGSVSSSEMAQLSGKANQWMLPNALGNIFNRGSLVPMANGGIVNSPTYFPMTGGRTGLMGEAGPEAVMPLSRTKGGKLGVSVESGGTQVINNVEVINQSSQPVNAKAGPARWNGKEYVTQIFLKDWDSNGPMRRTIKRGD